MQDVPGGTDRRHAGEGAAAQASAAAERAQRYRDKALAAERQEKAWRAGSEGERLVADALAMAGWPVLHDQPWPGRQRANIDHLVFSPSRLWLIEAKHWSGDVTVTDVLRQNGYSRRMAMVNVKVATADVADRLGSTAPHVMPVVCLTQAAADLPPTTVDGVLLVGLQHLSDALGPVPLLDLELARLMEKTPALLRGDAIAMTPPGRPARPASTRTRRPQRTRRKRKGPSVGRAAVALLLLVALYWYASNLSLVLP